MDATDPSIGGTRRSSIRLLRPAIWAISGVTCALLAVRIGIWIFVRYASLDWAEYTDSLLTEELARGRTVVVLYYSPLSVLSRKCENSVFADPRVREAIRRNRVTMIRANVEYGPCRAALQRETMDASIPTVAVYRGSTRRRPITITRQTEIDVPSVLSALQ